MEQVMVRYKITADKAVENKLLVRKVFEELEGVKPAGLRYASFKLEDGVSFVHIASIDTADGENPLQKMAAFSAFRVGLKDRCEDPPTAVDLAEIGSYRFIGSSRTRRPSATTETGSRPAELPVQ